MLDASPPFIGRQFGLLTVVGCQGKRRGRTLWLCNCVCGNTTLVNKSDLNSGNNESCGCLRKAQTRALNLSRANPNGVWRHYLYSSWYKMINRCDNKYDQAYKNYGGRGIKVCYDWYNFWQFVADMGDKPEPRSEYSLERKNNNLGYDKNNCKWATAKEQANNRRLRKNG